ncbi:ATP-binding protein [uncultured Eubacterium sp.]|uniref:ATP-binding protein n=1 Tax=uncultured Eubacterium sp. TaxID=165185 RepID=UPI0025F28728|nr:AAA family ATPase [uncultured Eubacterium sp.]MCI6538407.1 AAA family ATPase [Lachnospiraceae bacterium]
MIIREANIGKFGKLENQKYQFSPRINVIYGANESGKSTLMQFLKAMLFGLEKTRVRKTLDTYNRYEPWDTPAYFYGSMVFETGQQQFLLERNFYHKEKRARLVNIRDGEELSVEYGDLDMLLGNVSAAAYENTCCIGQEQLLPGRELGVLLEDERSNLAQTGSGDFQLSKALQELEQKRKHAEKTRKELEQQRLSRIHQLEVNQQVLERDIAGLKAQQEKQSTQQGTMQEQVRGLQQQMEPVQADYQTVCKREQELNSAVAQVQSEWEQAEREQWKQEQLQREQEEAEALQQKFGKNAGFSPLLLIGVAGLILAPVLRSAMDGFQKIAPFVNVVCIILILAGLASAYCRNRAKKEADAAQNHRQSVNDAAQDYREQNGRSNGGMDLHSVERERRKSALDQQLQRVRQQKSALEEQLQKLKDQKKALQLQAARQEGSGDQLQSQIQEKEVERENLTEQVDELQQETLEEQNARADREALELAAETMFRLAARMSKTLEHTLDKEMSEILAQITGDVHEQLQMNGAQGIVLTEQMQKRVPEAYSQGTMQQAYFAYRMAAGHMLMKEEPLPFLLDETFANYDEERLRQTLRWLAEQENQILLFTCRENEMRLLKEEGIPFASIQL